MHEEISDISIPKHLQEEPEFSWEERLAQFEKDHPALVIAPENRREGGPGMAELEKTMDLFEYIYSLEVLYSIVNLTQEEAPHHPLREPAKLAFSPMLKMLHALRDETDISPEKYKELEARWNNIANAVGIIKNDKVYHDRAH